MWWSADIKHTSSLRDVTCCKFLTILQDTSKVEGAGSTCALSHWLLLPLLRMVKWNKNDKQSIAG